MAVHPPGRGAIREFVAYSVVSDSVTVLKSWC
jgi:hypothetical protein